MDASIRLDHTLSDEEFEARLKLLRDPWSRERTGAGKWAARICGHEVRVRREDGHGPVLLEYNLPASRSKCLASFAALLGPESPRDRALRAIEETASAKAAALSLSSMGLTEVPAEIGQLVGIEALDLTGNLLTALPAGIGQLARIRELDVSENFLAALPAEIGQLGELTTLILTQNELTALPPEIGRLKKLRVLQAGENRLRALPPEIGELASLTQLWVENNRLTALPAELGRLTTLFTMPKIPAVPGIRDPQVKLKIGGNPLYDPPFGVRDPEVIGARLRAKLDDLAEAAGWRSSRHAAYVFKTELSLEAAMGLLQAGGWVSRRDKPDRLKYEAPHRGDERCLEQLTIALRYYCRIDVTLLSKVEEIEQPWQELLSYVLGSLLPSLHAKKVETEAVAERYAAYSFSSDVTFQEAVQILNAVEDWIGKPGLKGRWLTASNDCLGDYLWRSSSYKGDQRFKGYASIFVEMSPQQIAVKASSTGPEIEPMWQDLLSRMLYGVLPSLGARNVEPSDFVKSDYSANDIAR